ncbi:lymphotoxin-alpha-like [Haliotis rufescens]|uniref:lymphotoxin-alpha-like n=1 Tax=Haliotis rufescens TaxID=6454 RepID=UPI00201F8BBC|nr:lymphotoxin-alpha-like [Haliotis rufescens]
MCSLRYHYITRSPIISMEHTRCPNRGHRAVTTICILTLVMSAALNIPLIVLLVLNKVSRGHSNTAVTEETKHIGQGSLCVLCERDRREERSLPPSKDVDVVHLQGRRMCCLRHAGGLTHLVQLMSGYYFEHRGSKTDSGRTRHSHQNDVQPYTRPSAHLFLDQGAFKGTHLVWSTRPGFGTAHVTGVIVMENNSIFVQKDGLYFVYSSLTFTVRDGDITNGYVTYSLLRHNARYSPVSDILLITNVTLPHRERLFTAATLEENFSLRQGDVLSVHLSNYSYVYRFSSSNYFGVRQLSTKL